MKARICIATTILALVLASVPVAALENRPQGSEVDAAADTFARPDPPVLDDPRDPPYVDVYSFYKPQLVLRAAIVSLSNLLLGDAGDERVDECNPNGILPDCPGS